MPKNSKQNLQLKNKPRKQAANLSPTVKDPAELQPLLVRLNTAAFADPVLQRRVFLFAQFSPLRLKLSCHGSKVVWTPGLQNIYILRVKGVQVSRHSHHSCICLHTLVSTRIPYFLCILDKCVYRWFVQYMCHLQHHMIVCRPKKPLLDIPSLAPHKATRPGWELLRIHTQKQVPMPFKRQKNLMREFYQSCALNFIVRTKSAVQNHREHSHHSLHMTRLITDY